MNALISLTQPSINGELQQTVNARELYVFLESKQDFSTWMKNRIEKYGFVENQDFVVFHKKMESEQLMIKKMDKADKKHNIDDENIQLMIKKLKKAIADLKADL